MSKVAIDATNVEPAELLTTAIQAKDASRVRDVLLTYPQLKSRLNEPLPNYSFGAPAILAAVHTENRDVIDAVLDAGADIDARSDWWAGSYGVLDTANPTLAAYLISRGAHVDICAAARLGMVERVRELLAEDPQRVHARGGDGQTPLHFAATVEIASLLLDHGADIDARDIDHESTAAQYAACSRYYMDSQATYRHDVARFLIARGAQVDILMVSAVGDLARVERMLNEDPEAVNVTVSERYFPRRDPRAGGCIYIYGFGQMRSPHGIAREFGHTPVLELLLERSAPWLRFLWAAEVGDEARVQQMLQAEPGFASGLSGEAASRIVGPAFSGNTRAVQWMLDAGWPPGVPGDHNQTALHFAAWHGQAAMVRALIAHNAPLDVFETQYGGSPLAWALHGSRNSWLRQEKDYPGVVRALLAAGARLPEGEIPTELDKELREIVERKAC